MERPLTRVGITGHMDLTDDTVDLIRAALRDHLKPLASTGRLQGISCIAAGADSLFAEVVLELGGTLIVVLPSADYRATKVKPQHADQFDALISKAAQVITMPHEHANRAAYEAANLEVLSSCDRLVAVWDGQSPADQGGTGAVVEQARVAGLDTTIVWPDGATRKPKQ